MKALVILQSPGTGLTSAEEQALRVALAAGYEQVVGLSLGPLEQEQQERLREIGLQRTYALSESLPDAADSSVLASVVEDVQIREGGFISTFAAPTLSLRDTFGRLAIRHEAEVLSAVDEIRLEPELSLTARSSFDGGRRLATLTVADRAAYILVNPTPREVRTQPTDRLDIDVLPRPEQQALVRTLRTEPAGGAGFVPLQGAPLVVAGGRGIGSAARMSQLEKWAHSIGAAFGSSRAPVEDQWVSYDKLIGQTGTMISPEVYIAFGISGAPQHVSGIREARRIVAVNSDPAAPLSEEADLFLATDAQELLKVLLSDTSGLG